MRCYFLCYLHSSSPDLKQFPCVIVSKKPKILSNIDDTALTSILREHRGFLPRKIRPKELFRFPSRSRTWEVKRSTVLGIKGRDSWHGACA